MAINGEAGFIEKTFWANVEGYSGETLTTIIETGLRLKCLVDPRMHFRFLRTKAPVNGHLTRQSTTICIFVLMAKGKISQFILNALGGLRDAGIDVIIVNNSNAAPAVKDTLLKYCYQYIQRANIGRDFGAFKDVLPIAEAQSPDRILLLNDSLFYFGDKLAEIFKRLAFSDRDVTGLTDTHEHLYHIQSFAISFNKRVYTNKYYKAYWNSYVPYSTRKYSIDYGECGLTYMMTQKIGVSVDVVYTAEALAVILEALPAEDLYELVRWMPRVFKNDFADEIAAYANNMLDSDLIAYRRALSGGEMSDQKVVTGPATVIIDELGQKTSQIYAQRFEYMRQKFARDIFDYIALRNGMSIGGFAYIKYLQMPMLKRDVVYRELYTLPEVHVFLDEIGIDSTLHAEIMGDLRRKGYPYWLRGMRKFMYIKGML